MSGHVVSGFQGRSAPPPVPLTQLSSFLSHSLSLSLSLSPPPRRVGAPGDPRAGQPPHPPDGPLPGRRRHHLRPWPRCLPPPARAQESEETREGRATPSSSQNRAVGCNQVDEHDRGTCQHQITPTFTSHTVNGMQREHTGEGRGMRRTTPLSRPRRDPPMNPMCDSEVWGTIADVEASLLLHSGQRKVAACPGALGCLSVLCILVRFLILTSTKTYQFHSQVYLEISPTVFCTLSRLCALVTFGN